jgi:TonB family protein
MKYFQFILILSITVFTPALISAQNSVEEYDQDLLGLTEYNMNESQMLSDELHDALDMNKEADKALRIDILSGKPSLDDAERLELFDLQTAELQTALKQYLDERLEYPTEMKEYQIEGTVIVECVFTQDGKLLSPKIFKGLHPSCDKASLQALQGFEYDRAAYRGAKRIHVPLAFILE